MHDMRPSRAILLTWAAGVLTVAAAAPPALAAEPNVSARLIASTSAVVPGQGFLLGVELTMADGWHVYWKNPGDAGLATEVQWQVPKAFQQERLPWPVPIRFTMPGDITSFGYSGSVMLATQWLAPKDLRAGETVTLAAKVSWLACKDLCVPGQATVRLTLPVAGERQAANGDLFRTWFDRLPHSPRDPKHTVEVSVDRAGGQQAGGTYTVTLAWPGTVTGVDWFPVPGPAVEISDVKVIAKGTQARITFRASVLKGLKLDRDTMESVVAYTDAKGRRRGVRVDVPLVAKKEAKPAAP